MEERKNVNAHVYMYILEHICFYQHMVTVACTNVLVHKCNGHSMNNCRVHVSHITMTVYLRKFFENPVVNQSVISIINITLLRQCPPLLTCECNR